MYEKNEEKWLTTFEFSNQKKKKGTMNTEDA